MNLHEDLITMMIQDMNQKKEKVVQSVLDKLDTGIILKDELHKLFKSVHSRTIGGEETWFFNDGSVEGRRFLKFTPKIENNENGLGYEFEYTIHYF
jgi:hypothetical protein